MPLSDDPNFLRIGPPEHPGEAEITPAMVAGVRQRIKEAGGILTVWAVLIEDLYDSKYGDGISLHVRGIALSSIDAERLAALAGKSELSRWIVKGYRLGLKDDLPVFLIPWLENFTINEFVVIFCEIPPGGSASKLHTGTGRRQGWPSAFTALNARGLLRVHFLLPGQPSRAAALRPFLSRTAKRQDVVFAKGLAQ